MNLLMRSDRDRASRLAPRPPSRSRSFLCGAPRSERPGWSSRHSSSSRPSRPSCCCWHAPTWPTCCWCGPSDVGASSPSACATGPIGGASPPASHRGPLACAGGRRSGRLVHHLGGSLAAGPGRARGRPERAARAPGREGAAGFPRSLHPEQSRASGSCPALRASRSEPTAILKDEAGSVSPGLQRSRLANGLVVAQLSLAYVLLVFAGLFSVSYHKALSTIPVSTGRGLCWHPSICCQPGTHRRSRGSVSTGAAGRAWRPSPACNRQPWRTGCRSARRNAPTDRAGGLRAPAPRIARVLRANVGPRYFETLRIPLERRARLLRHDTETSLPR